jgi:hypothetical protein
MPKNNKGKRRQQNYFDGRNQGQIDTTFEYLKENGTDGTVALAAVTASQGSGGFTCDVPLLGTMNLRTTENGTESALQTACKKSTSGLRPIVILGHVGGEKGGKWSIMAIIPEDRTLRRKILEELKGYGLVEPKQSLDATDDGDCGLDFEDAELEEEELDVDAI